VSVTLINNPFSDVTYNLRDPEKVKKFDINAIAKVNTLIDCGKLAIVFYNFNDQKSALN